MKASGGVDTEDVSRCKVVPVSACIVTEVWEDQGSKDVPESGGTLDKVINQFESREERDWRFTDGIELSLCTRSNPANWVRSLW